LKPRRQREHGVDEVIRQLAPKLATVPGIRVYLQNPPTVRVGGRLSKSLYQFTLPSTDVPSLYDGATRLEKQMRSLPSLNDVTSSLQIKNPQLNVAFERERGSARAITASQVEEALYDAYGSRQVSTIYSPDNQYWVVLELHPQSQRDLAALSHLSLRS